MVVVGLCHFWVFSCFYTRSHKKSFSQTSYICCPDGPQRVLPCSALIEMYEEAELVHAALMLVCTCPCALQK